jgi:hypothetical protein
LRRFLRTELGFRAELRCKDKRGEPNEKSEIDGGDDFDAWDL